MNEPEVAKHLREYVQAHGTGPEDPVTFFQLDVVGARQLQNWIEHLAATGPEPVPAEITAKDPKYYAIVSVTDRVVDVVYAYSASDALLKTRAGGAVNARPADAIVVKAWFSRA